MRVTAQFRRRDEDEERVEVSADVSLGEHEYNIVLDPGSDIRDERELGDCYIALIDEWQREHHYVQRWAPYVLGAQS